MIDLYDIESEEKFNTSWYKNKKYSLENNPNFTSRLDYALPLTKNLIAQMTNYTEVPAMTYAIRKMPLVSFGYFGCRALILNSGDSIILGHLTPREDNRRFISQIIDDLQVNPSSINGIVIGGYEPELIARYARDQGIKINGCFQDFDRTTYLKNTQKDLIVKNIDEIFLINSQGIKKLSLRNTINPFLKEELVGDSK